MNKYFSIIVFFISFFFFSCQKEVTTDNFSSNNNSSNNLIDSNYLDKIYQVYMTGGSYDTVGVWIYNYDNLKRVSSMVLQSIDPSITDGVSYQYFYNNLDTLPYKTVSIETSNNIANTTIHFHFWDGNGRNLQDSSLYTNGGVSYYLVRSYSYGNNMIMGSQYTDLSAGPIINLTQKDTATTDSYGNILQSKKYVFNTNNNIWELSSTTSYNNDGKRSPFSILSNYKTFRVFPSGETLYYELPVFYNSTSQTETNSIQTGNPNTNNFTNTNLYNSNNQLSVVTINATYSSSTPETTRLIFTYKSL
jgi:hypothetical protein